MTGPRKRVVDPSGEQPLADRKSGRAAAGAEDAERTAGKRGAKHGGDVSLDHPIDIGPRGSSDTW